jgi:hypothetical protein
MKSSSISALRISAKMRREAESVLRDGETLSDFVLDAVTRSVKLRKAQQLFLARGLASAARAKATGWYVPANRVLGKLRRRLASARQRAG